MNKVKAGKIKSFLLSMGLRNKFLISTTGVILLLGVVTITFIYLSQSKTLTKSLLDKGITITRNLAVNSVDPILTQNIIKLQNLISNIHMVEDDVSYIFILDSNGSVLVHTFKVGVPSELKEVHPPSPGSSVSIKLLEADEEFIQDIAVPIFGDIGTVHVGISEKNIKQTIINTILSLLSITLIVLLFGEIMVTFIVVRVLKPLSQLSKGADIVGNGNLKHRIQVSTMDEVGVLANKFNLMTGRIRDSLQQIESSKEYMDSIVSTVPSLLIVLNKNMDLISTNMPFDNTIKKLSGITPSHFITPLKETITECIETGIQAKKEIILAPEDSEEKLFFHSVISRIGVPDEEKDGVLLTMTDITGLKHTEEELTKRQYELSALYTISSAISKTIDISKLFPIIIDTITRLKMFNVEPRGGIFIIEGNSMKLVSHAMVSEDFLQVHNDMKIGDCLCGLAAKTGEIIISKNSHEDSSRHTLRYEGMPPHGHIIIPLTSRKTVIGVLCLYLPPDIDIDENSLKLLTSMRSQIGIVIENARLYEETKKSSLQDSLTGLANRRLMNIELERTFARAKRLEQTFSAIMMDIDHFKKYNDTFGHSAGDNVLIDVADVTSRETRDIDLVIRYGGEEFLVLLPATELKMATEIAERIRSAVETNTDITVSLGVSVYDKNMKNGEAVINNADKALYMAKENGRNRVEVN